MDKSSSGWVGGCGSRECTRCYRRMQLPAPYLLGYSCGRERIDFGTRTTSADRCTKYCLFVSKQLGYKMMLCCAALSSVSCVWSGSTAHGRFRPVLDFPKYPEFIVDEARWLVRWSWPSDVSSRCCKRNDSLRIRSWEMHQSSGQGKRRRGADKEEERIKERK